MAQLFDESLDPDGRGFMSTIKTWNDRELRNWLNYHLLPYADVDALSRVFCASKLTDETELVVKWLNSHGKGLPPRSLAAFNLQYALSAFYSSIIGDVDKAKVALHSVLTTEPNVDARNKDIIDYERSDARLITAGIIFEQFSASSDPERKEELINEFKQLPGTAEGEVSFSESHIGMLYANMLRIMGPAREYQKQMNLIFQSCIENLSDEDSFNDGSTLRLLAKVLSFLDGLEFDATLALSAQFSVLDRELHQASLAKLRTDEESEAAESTRSDNNEAGDTTRPQGAIIGDDIPPSIYNVQDDELVSEPVAIVKYDDPISQADVREDLPLKSEETLEKYEEDQDLTGDRAKLGCDGDCGTMVMQWDQPFYLCLICPNIDLCATCLDEKRASAKEEMKQKWKRKCSPDHYFIKGPMKGWNGIKEGVIRIEQKEPFTVKQWLKEMKEDRWPRAWERYWLKQGGLRNINDED